MLKYYVNFFYLAFRLPNPNCETQRFSNTLEGSHCLVRGLLWDATSVLAQVSPAFVRDYLEVLCQLQQLLLWKGVS